MANLVLGIGNFSKPVLAECEPTFSSWNFAVLDFWSVVQEINFVEREQQVGEYTLRFRRDLSYFVSQPKLTVRFGPDRYDPSNTQKVLGYTVDYRKALRGAIQTDLEAISNQFGVYERISIVTDAADEITLECFPLLLPAWLHAGKGLQVLSAFPAPYRGEVMADYAKQVAKTLSFFKVQHHEVSEQDIFDHANKSSVSDVLCELRTMLCESLVGLLS